jgi:hypothetical protein
MVISLLQKKYELILSNNRLNQLFFFLTLIQFYIMDLEQIQKPLTH